MKVWIKVIIKEGYMRIKKKLRIEIIVYSSIIFLQISLIVINLYKGNLLFIQEMGIDLMRLEKENESSATIENKQLGNKEEPPTLTEVLYYIFNIFSLPETEETIKKIEDKVKAVGVQPHSILVERTEGIIVLVYIIGLVMAIGSFGAAMVIQIPTETQTPVEIALNRPLEINNHPAAIAEHVATHSFIIFGLGYLGLIVLGSIIYGMQ